jgi:hypothetical protein
MERRRADLERDDGEDARRRGPAHIRRRRRRGGAAAVQFARHQGVLVGVKGGGHNIAGTSIAQAV